MTPKQIEKKTKEIMINRISDSDFACEVAELIYEEAFKDGKELSDKEEAEFDMIYNPIYDKCLKMISEALK